MLALVVLEVLHLARNAGQLLAQLVKLGDDLVLAQLLCCRHGLVRSTYGVAQNKSVYATRL